MKVLLDTHAFMWFVDGNERLPRYTRSLIEKRGNERLLSIGSLWEMAIKASLGKLEVRGPFVEIVTTQLATNDIWLLPIQASHLDTLRALPFHHRDPFDRLIIAQGIVEGAVILSRDKLFDYYPIKRCWRDTLV